MTRMKIVLVPVATLVAAASTLSLTVLPAAAEPGSGRAYGQHVAACAHDEGGFTRADNPGMHQGFSGWDGGC